MRPVISLMFLLSIPFAFTSEPANEGSRPSTTATPSFAVVELFTSEGCSSCPPAEAYLNELARRSRSEDPAIYPLAFHVDYWDYLGWKDPAARPEHSRRQRLYARLLEPNRVYTPQMFVNGGSGFVGSDRATGDLVIEQALKRTERPTQSGSTKKPTLSLEGSAVERSVEIQYRVTHLPKGCVLNLALVSDVDPHTIRAGENRGRKLHHANVVRNFAQIELDTANARGNTSLKLPKDLKGQSISVIGYIQNAETLAVLAAARLTY